MAEVTGFGGLFVRVDDPERLAAWYEQHLGLKRNGSMLVFPSEVQPTPAFAFFGRDDDYFAREQPAMVNLQVDDLDGLLDRLAAAGVSVDDERASHEYGRFGWFVDPEGNRVELWQPA